VRIWLVVLALAVAVAGIVLYVQAHEPPIAVAPPPLAQPPTAMAMTIDASVRVVADAMVPVDAAPEASLETLRSSGPSSEVWVHQATNLLRGFDPHTKVECYVAGCSAALSFDSEEAYQQAFEVVRVDETWTGGKKWLPPERQAGRVTAVLILYRPD
jgi:hypothetical protein